MELTDIMALVRAGYTKDEIALMETPGTAEQIPAPAPVETPEPSAQQTPVQAPVAVAEPVAIPQPQPTQQEEQPTMAELMQSIAKLTSAVQANAIAQSVIPQGLQNPPSAEDMLAEIIRPTYKERI